MDVGPKTDEEQPGGQAEKEDAVEKAELSAPLGKLADIYRPRAKIESRMV